MKKPYDSIFGTMRQSGFTLVELLISSFILIILMVIVTQGFKLGGQEVSRVIGINDIAEDTRLAGQIMADSAAKAVYVYPPGTVLNLGNGYTTREPGQTDGSSWTVGTDPIFAFLEAPANPTGNCSTDDTACMYFVAYYPVLRDQVVVGASGAARPNVDPANDSSWILFELRAKQNASTLLNNPGVIGSTFAAPPVTISGVAANILADYIAPGTGFVIDFSSPSSYNCRLGSTTISGSLLLCQLSSMPLNALNTVLTARFSLQGRVAKTNLPNPVTTQPFQFSIAPRNLYIKI